MLNWCDSFREWHLLSALGFCVVEEFGWLKASASPFHPKAAVPCYQMRKDALVYRTGTCTKKKKLDLPWLHTRLSVIACMVMECPSWATVLAHYPVSHGSPLILAGYESRGLGRLQESVIEGSVVTQQWRGNPICGGSRDGSLTRCPVIHLNDVLCWRDSRPEFMALLLWRKWPSPVSLFIFFLIEHSHPCCPNRYVASQDMP